MTVDPNTASVLVVDDEPAALQGMRRALRSRGFGQVLVCAEPGEVPALLERERISLVLLDLIMPGQRGEEVLASLAQRDPELPVIVVTAEYDVRTAVDCMKAGAVDYLVKPVSPDQLASAVARALEARALRDENARLREQFFAEAPSRSEAFAEIITSHPAMLRIFGYLEAIAQGTHPVLITGETGTGKELVARALHRVAARGGPFVAVSVAGLDDTLLSDTLFGHRPGAFTGAQQARTGMIDRAGRGTLFLDEIGDLSPASQVKLLRLLQEREYFPLGADRARPMRARVVAATHKDPATLREDLYYRLRAYHVHVPALRERTDDLPALVDHFLGLAAADLGKPKPRVPVELFAHLASYPFPGNVRELQAIVFDAVARHGGASLPLRALLDAVSGGAPDAAPGEAIRFPSVLPSLRDIEAAAVREALERTGGNRSAAARMLGVSRPTIARQASRGS